MVMAAMGNVERMYFVVRDAFGDNVGVERYPSFDDAADFFKQHCETKGKEADGAWIGIVYYGEDRPYRCALVQHHMTPLGNRYQSMESNISERAIAIPEIKLAALKASQLQYPFDERTQMRIDELEKQLGVYERDVSAAGDLYMGKWRVHIIPPGGRYGLNNNLTNKDKESLVEFWDTSAKKSVFPDGQFVSRYGVESLYDTKWGPGAEAMMRGGLCLDGGNADVWSVSGNEMIQVFDWLKKRELLAGENYLRFSGEVEVPFDVVDHIPLPHMDSAYLASEVVLNQRLNGLAFVRDLRVERMGEYKNGTGYSFSFNAQAVPDQAAAALDKALADMPHDVYFEKMSVHAAKKELDEIIYSCEYVNKGTSSGNNRDCADKNGRDSVGCHADMEER